jgi:hypothetical protein
MTFIETIIKVINERSADFAECDLAPPPIDRMPQIRPLD